jgi:hypothetical protein
MTARYHPRPKRWPQVNLRFSLRTGFVLLTVLCVWLGLQVKWIRDRDDVLRSRGAIQGSERPAAPWPLRWFGEGGYAGITISQKDSEEQIERLRQLFPEATVDYSADDGFRGLPNSQSRTRRWSRPH